MEITSEMAEKEITRRRTNKTRTKSRRLATPAWARNVSGDELRAALAPAPVRITPAQAQEVQVRAKFVAQALADHALVTWASFAQDGALV